MMHGDLLLDGRPNQTGISAMYANSKQGKHADMFWSKCTAMRMMALALLLLIAVTVAATGKAVTNTTPGQPTPSRGGCEKWSDATSCEVSWYRLQADPAAYRGKIVGLTGYLVSNFGDLVLYPDKIHYDSGSEVDSIILERPFAVSREIVDKAASGAYPVFVLGRFGPAVEADVHTVPRSGSLYDIRKILTVPRIPSGAPLDTDGIRILPSEN